MEADLIKVLEGIVDMIDEQISNCPSENEYEREWLVAEREKARKNLLNARLGVKE